MRLDPATCNVGTKGYIPPSTTGAFGGPDDFEWFSSDPVLLNADGRWISSDNRVMSEGTTVYSDWKEAVEHTIRAEMDSAMAQIQEAVRDYGDTAKVRAWLNETK